MGVYVMFWLVLFVALVVAPIVCRIEDGVWPWSNRNGRNTKKNALK